MDVIQEVQKMLIEDEGKKSHVYRDSLGIFTLGIGRNVDEDGKGLTDDEMLYLLANDIRECIADLETFPFWRKLTDARKVALINFRFQLGPVRFRKFTKTIEMLNQSQYARAGAAMLNSLWAKQTPARAKRISYIVSTGLLK